ncbi:MAG: SprT family zinc-dependent metalloprotease [Stellaceae bacterium]
MTALPQRIALGQAEMKLNVSRHPRARRFVLRLDERGESIELVLPRWGSLKEAGRFLEQNRGWLEQRLKDLPPRVAFADGSEIPLLGRPHRIRHRPAARGKGAAWIEDGEIHVAGEAAHLPRRLRDFLRAYASRELSARAHALAGRIGRKVSGIRLSDGKSRWGSCSAKGELAFSWRLILGPEDVLHYVVAHEVAHLAEMNHGPRFWKLVETLAPGFADGRAWLRRNRARLLRFG